MRAALVWLGFVIIATLLGTPALSYAQDQRDVREDRFLAQNTWYGPVGGIRVVDAGSALEGTFRLQLAASFFRDDGFLVGGDENEHIAGALSMSATLTDFLEVFASVMTSANSNEAGNPELFQVLGDLQFGAKGFYEVLPWLTVGGDLSIAFLNTVGDIGLVFDSTTIGLRANASADLRRTESEIPLIVRFNGQYVFDNSSELVEDIEARRYANLPESVRRPFDDEDRHLVTRIERFALNINRVDFLNVALGFEAPVEVAHDFHVNPIAEWRLGIPINRQGYECLLIPAPQRDPADPLRDEGCLDDEGVSAWPQTLTLGVRVLPPVRGLATFAALDIGITGTSDFVRELAPTPPYNILFGLSYAYDTRMPTGDDAREIQRYIRVQGPEPLVGRIRGLVVERAGSRPVEGAVVHFTGRPDLQELTALITEAPGRFISPPLPPGAVTMEITHPEYKPGTCTTTIPDVRPVQGELMIDVRCEVEQLPRLGNLRLRVVGQDGAAIERVNVSLSGPANRNLQTDVAGRTGLDSIPSGTYTIRVDSEDHLLSINRVELQPQQTAEPEIILIARPRQPLVRLQKRAISIRRQINFGSDSAVILPTSLPLMTEIADVILRNPQLQKIEIQGHTDDRGTDEHNLELSQQRSDSVRIWLIEHGVEENRLEARGYGETQPLVPNITPANRARNRRVQFIIREQTGEDGQAGSAEEPAPAASGAATSSP